MEITCSSNAIFPRIWILPQKWSWQKLRTKQSWRLDFNASVSVRFLGTHSVVRELGVSFWRAKSPVPFIIIRSKNNFIVPTSFMIFNPKRFARQNFHLKVKKFGSSFDNKDKKTLIWFPGEPRISHRQLKNSSYAPTEIEPFCLVYSLPLHPNFKKF